jgi:hypothetical protein
LTDASPGDGMRHDLFEIPMIPLGQCSRQADH